MGAKEAVLVAKHGCGFALWPSNATEPDGSRYNYRSQSIKIGLPRSTHK